MTSHLPALKHRLRLMSHVDRCPVCAKELGAPIIAAELCHRHARLLRSEGPLGAILVDALEMLAIQQEMDAMRHGG
ncbi:MAG: hypothetical protein KGH75_00480, partial [Rhodospirillales bacterium]|nr:hypothetical protein [Rhodospirillales bacterium]